MGGEVGGEERLGRSKAGAKDSGDRENLEDMRSKCHKQKQDERTVMMRMLPCVVQRRHAHCFSTAHVLSLSKFAF